MDELLTREFALVALANLDELEQAVRDRTLAAPSALHLIQIGDALRSGHELGDALKAWLGALPSDKIAAVTKALLQQAETAVLALDEGRASEQTVLAHDALESGLRGLGRIARLQQKLPRDLPGYNALEGALASLQQKQGERFNREEAIALLGPRAQMHQPYDWAMQLPPAPVSIVGIIAKRRSRERPGSHGLLIALAAAPVGDRLAGEHPLVALPEVDLSYSLDAGRLLLDLKLERALKGAPILRTMDAQVERAHAFEPTTYSKMSWEAALSPSTSLKGAVLEVPVEDETLAFLLDDYLDVD
jgi:hypothetical protein